MTRFGLRHWLYAAVLAVFVLAAVVPAYAGYDKFYRFKNTTGSPQSAVRAILMGFEVIGAQYTDPAFNPWGAGTVGLENVGGVYCSTIDWSDASALTTAMKLGWNSTDHSLQLRDFRWGTGDVITPNIDLSNVPGGGELTHVPGWYKWTITNDTGTTILLGRPEGSTVEVGDFTVPLSLDSGNLGQLADQGISGHIILLLIVAVEDASEEGLIPDPSATSLLKKLFKAQDALDLALRALENGDMPTFYYQQAAAVKAMTTFVSELRRSNKVPEDIRDDLAAQGDAVIARLNVLPEGVIPEGYGVTGPAGTSGVPYSLASGESFTLWVPDISTLPEGGANVGDSLVMHGAVVDPDDGTISVDWVDQALIKADLESPTLTVSPPEAVVGSLDGPLKWFNHPVTVTLQASDGGGSGVQGLYILEGEGTPPPVLGVSPQYVPYDSEEPPERTYASGTHWLVAVATDGDLNLSEQKIIKVGIDTTPPVIVWDEPPTTPDRLWSPDHTLRLVQLNYNVIEENDCTVEVTAVSSEVDDGQGDCGGPDDIEILDEHNVLLRSERWGGGDGRYYTIWVTATDVAGNSASDSVVIWVSHDQGSKVIE